MRGHEQAPSLAAPREEGWRWAVSGGLVPAARAVWPLAVVDVPLCVWVVWFGDESWRNVNAAPQLCAIQLRRNNNNNVPGG